MKAKGILVRDIKHESIDDLFKTNRKEHKILIGYKKGKPQYEIQIR